VIIKQKMVLSSLMVIVNQIALTGEIHRLETRLDQPSH
jgi:hypothetical protein